MEEETDKGGFVIMKVALLSCRNNDHMIPFLVTPSVSSPDRKSNDDMSFSLAPAFLQAQMFMIPSFRKSFCGENLTNEV